MRLKPGRNEPCTCGSGKKYKKCCGRDYPERLAVPGGEGKPVPQAQVEQLVGLIGTQRYASAESMARELLLHDPDNGSVWKALSAALWMQGKDALEPLRKAAQLLPTDAEAQCNLGNALRAVGRADEAVESHRRALRIRPNYAAAHLNLGSALQDLGRLDEAVSSFRRAIKVNGGMALAHSNLATALLLQHHAAEAEACCRKALEIEPNFAPAIVQLAQLRGEQGQFGEAEQLLRRVIEIDPNLPEAWAGLAQVRDMRQGDTVWLRGVQRLLQQPLSPQREMSLRYALGKYLDDLKEFDQAFVNYRRANELKRVGRPAYVARELASRIDAIIDTYDRQWLESVAGRGSESPRPIFIVGMWRCGSSLTEQILASHPAVFGAGELDFWNAASTEYERAASSGIAGEASLRKLIGDYLELLSRQSTSASRVVDKWCANYLHLGLIYAAFPQAHIIHVRRNPIDTCLSIYFQNFAGAHVYAHDLADLAHYYTEYLRVMKHWRQTLPENKILEVSYEQLIGDQEAWSRKMVEFVGLDWDPQCMEFHKTKRTVRTVSRWQVRQSMNRWSVERWRNYAKHIQPLLALENLHSVH